MPSAPARPIGFGVAGDPPIPLEPAILLWGDFDGERVDLGEVAGEFGWRVKPFDPLGAWTAVAVIVDAAGDEDWRDRVRASTILVPHAPVVVARRFNPESCDCDPVRDGVFDVLLRPFDPAECRQSFGFLHHRLARRGRRLLSVRAA
ncbi:MAG: hypothetical protein R2762_27380 [Bryobacteraceae bacterium]